MFTRTGLLSAAALLEYALMRGSNAVIDRIKKERLWVPLSEEYPNLMGVTDEDIERYKQSIRAEYEKKVANIKESVAKIKRKLEEAKREGKSTKTYERILRAHVGLLEELTTNDRSIMDKLRIKYVDVIEKDYLRYVEILNRQQIYDIAVELGNKLKKRFNQQFFISNDMIFITTPRGGFEFLSIFAYANNIPKAMIPADISEKFFGRNWLGGRTSTIKTVVIVDDIVASGQQIKKMYDEVKRIIPSVEQIIPVFIAARKWPWAISIDKKVYDSTLYGIKTIGIKSWQSKKNPVPGKDIITVGFPWSIPDGNSDRYLQKLYGSRSNRGRRINV